MSLAASLPYDHPYAGGFPGLSSQSLPTDSDCLAYLAAVAAADGAGVETGVAVAVDTFFAALKATPGLFDAIKASCILCGARTLAGALVPLAGAAPTANGFVAADYSRAGGLTGDAATTYLDTGRADTEEGQDDLHAAVYIPSYSPPAVNGYFLGAGINQAGATSVIGRTSDTGTRCRSGTFTAAAQIVAPTLFAVSRGSAGSYQVRLNSSTATVSQASTGRTGEEFFVFAANNSGATEPIAGPIAFYSIGTDIGSAGLAALEASLDNLIAAMQFHFNTGLNPSGYDADTIAYINAGYAAGGSLE